MKPLRVFLSRLQTVVRRGRKDRDLDDEIASHLAEATDEYVRQGLSPEEAHWAARRSFGGAMQVKEVHREIRAFGWLDDLARDVGFGARMLVKDRWITLAAVAALAIGIAANMTVFAIVNAILLRDLPVYQPDRIVAIGIQADHLRTLRGGVSYADFQDWRAGAVTFAGLAAMSEATMNVSDRRSAPERFIGSYISANAFGLLRQQPILGRDFTPDDDRRGAAPVVILGDTLWRTRYGSDSGVLGRTIRVNGRSSAVIGVMPDGFSFPTRSRLWQPLALLPETVLVSRDARHLSAFGRLAPGVSIEQSAAELAGIARALAEAHPETNRGVAPIVAPFRDRSVGGRGRSTLPVLMGVVAVVLLMACANVANLLLARAAVRGHEIAVRIAMGAGRVRIIQQLLVESLLLAGLAGAAGWALSVHALRVVSIALDGGGDVGLPYWIVFTMDQQVFAFSVALCLGTALFSGLIPALQTSAPGVGHTLRESGRGPAATARSRRWTHGLVVLQLALAPMLLTGGGLMMRSIVAQYEMDAGVDTARILWARLDLPDAQYPGDRDRMRFYQQLDERLAGMPGVVAGMVSHTPFGGGVARNVWLDGEDVTRAPRRPRVLEVTVGPRYFETFRKSVLRGSELPLLEPDGAASIIVNEWLAAAVFPGQSPIGQRIRLTPLSYTSAGPEPFTIAGVAPNIRQSSTEDASGRDGVVYVSYGTNPLPHAGIVARSDSASSAVAAALREQVRAVDPDLPLFDVMTLDDVLAASDERVGLRVFGTMFVVFAVVALLLATVGLYAVTAFAAAQRTREIGLRVALGAQASQIWWLVTRSAAGQLGLGLSIGMAGAVVVSRVLAGVLVGTDALDPATMVAVAAVLALVGLCACFAPARRAMRLDPAGVLRAD